MERLLNTHTIPEVQNPVTVMAIDAPGPGGAHHQYRISHASGGPEPPRPLSHTYINFQKGGVEEVGVNGLTIEALLAVCIDRLECFQAGPFQCKENGQALHHLNHAMGYLHDRTIVRRARGVEGKQEP